jgi:hypothetical protein
VLLNMVDPQPPPPLAIVVAEPPLTEVALRTKPGNDDELLDEDAAG